MSRKLGFNIRGEDDYKYWQDLILSEAGVECSVVVTSHAIEIRAPSYRDFVLARYEVSKRTGMEVVRG